MGAGQGEVRGLVAPLVLLGDDVIDLVAELHGRLRDPAVFAPRPGPPPDSPRAIFRHEGGFARLSDSRAFDRRTASSRSTRIYSSISARSSGVSVPLRALAESSS